MTTSKLEWEAVEQMGLSADVRTHRARVHGGWLYRLGVAMTFVPELAPAPAMREMFIKALLMNDANPDPELLDDLMRVASGKDPSSEDH